MSVSYVQLKQYVPFLKNELVGKHISKIILLTKNVYSFSITKNKNVVISLQNQDPFISVTEFKTNYSSLPDNQILQIKKELSNALITNIELLENNRVLIFSLKTINDVFKEENKFLVLELIPGKANFIILNCNKTINFSLKQNSDSRILLKNTIYEYPINNITIDLSSLPSFDIDYEYKVSLILEQRKKEKFKEILKFVKNKNKNSEQKIKNILDDVEKAKQHLHDQEIGNIILMHLNEIKYKDKELIVDDICIKLDPRLKPYENSEMYFKRARKAKATITQSEINLKRAEEEKKTYESLLNIFDSCDEEECTRLFEEFEITSKITKSAKKQEIALISASNHPYFFSYEGTTVLFGKNSKQNDYLSFFADTSKQHIWMHIVGNSGSHLMIKSGNPSNELINICGELLCYASKQVDGQVMLTKRANIRKGANPGEVIVKEYKIIRINSVSEKAKNFYINSTKI